MKKQIFLFALAAVLAMPLMSFKSTFNLPLKYETALRNAKKPTFKNKAIVELGQFNRDGYTYLVYGDNTNYTASSVYYWNGSGWVSVASVFSGDWTPTSPVYIAHLQIKRTGSSFYFIYTGYLYPPVPEA